MEKGVLNTYSKPITVKTPEKKDADGKVTEAAKPDVVLQTGLNRLSQADYATIKAVPVIVSYFETGILRDVKIKQTPRAQRVEVEKTIDQMTVAELKAHAQKKGVDLAGASKREDILAVLGG